MTEPKDLLALTISGLYKSGTYSDLKIVCGPDTYHVHKNIICPQSEFFRAACRPDAFQEGKTGVVLLPGNPGRDTNALQVPITVDEFDWDLDVENLNTIRYMIHYFYHHDYPSDLPTCVNHNALTLENAAKGVLATHAQMYAMGEKYQVPGLKALAVRRYESSWFKTSAGFNTAIVIAFMSTPETDQKLRKVIVNMIASNKWLARNEELDKTIKEIPELVHAVYSRLVEKD